jgi:hypothetical protein
MRIHNTGENYADKAKTEEKMPTLGYFKQRRELLFHFLENKVCILFITMF